MSAARAAFAGWKESVSNPNLFAIPRGLVFQHRPELTEASATDVLGEAVVAHHSPHIEVFNGDDVEPAHQVCRQLVEHVLARVGNLGVDLRHFPLLSLPSSASLLLARKGSLCQRQLRCILGSMSRVGVASAITQRCQPRDSQVDPDLLSGFWKRDFIWFIQTKTHEVSPAAVLGYRDCGWLACELAAPLNTEATDFGNCKVAVGGIPFESGNGVFGGLLPVL